MDTDREKALQKRKEAKRKGPFSLFLCRCLLSMIGEGQGDSDWHYPTKFSVSRPYLLEYDSLLMVGAISHKKIIHFTSLI